MEIHNHLRRLRRQIRSYLPHMRLAARGDGHLRRPEAIAWCEGNCVDYIRRAGNAVLDRLLTTCGCAVPKARRQWCASIPRPVRADGRSWRRERRVAEGIEARTP